MQNQGKIFRIIPLQKTKLRFKRFINLKRRGDTQTNDLANIELFYMISTYMYFRHKIRRTFNKLRCPKENKSDEKEKIELLSAQHKTLSFTYPSLSRKSRGTNVNTAAWHMLVAWASGLPLKPAMSSRTNSICVFIQMHSQPLHMFVSIL